MTKDEIIALAKEVGFSKAPASPAMLVCSPNNIERFANAIRTKERERCAMVIENGHFLHDQAPDKLFANQASKAIRSLE